jgi:SAM-dependent methyltransferase
VSTVSEYWDRNVSNWKVARHLEPGSEAFFREVERYRFDKLDYLEEAVPFDGLAGRAVLDLGCGLGTDTSRFARGGAVVTGVDIAPRAVALARENFRWRGLEGRFETMDGERLDFPDDTFDFVYCHTVLHFTPDPKAMIGEVHRVLRPGGRAVLMTINRESWLYAMHRIAGTRLDYMDAPVFHKMSPAEFEEALAVFEDRELRLYRYPVPTEVHRGWKAFLYNSVFVRAFHAAPKALTRNSGYHMLAFVRKPDGQMRDGQTPDGQERGGATPHAA